MDDTRRISVVVPCYNRAAYLSALLQSLTWSAVTPDDFEVVVVNDGGVDHVGMVVDSWRQRGLDVRLLQLRTQGEPRNNARARNAGLREASHPIVIQTDPDIVFASDVLLRVRDTMTKDRFCSVSGYYPLTREATLELAFGDGGPCRRAAEFLAHAVGRPNQVLSPDGVGGLHGAFACATEDLRRIGGYDESFEYWGWEDRELLVTLTHEGLVRHTMDDTPVVHLWHPALRGETHRHTLASRGQISRAAWDLQMQRASAEYPRPARPKRRPSPHQDHRAPLAFRHDAYDEWIDDASTRQVRYQLSFDAHRLEAAELLASGHAALACDVLVMTAKRPWEGEPDAEVAEATAGTVESTDLAAWLRPDWRRYVRVELALELVVRCHAELGNIVARDAALGVLERLPDGTAAAAAIRAQLALAAGDLRAASRESDALRGSGWTAARAALAIEIALLNRRFDEAADLISASGVTDNVRGDYFEELRWIEYRRLIQSESGINVPANPRPCAAENERSEFLYSAALRSLRAGLVIGACRLLDRFLTSAPPAEPRLLVEGRRHAEWARQRVRALETPAAVHAGCGQPSSAVGAGFRHEFAHPPA